MVKALRIAAGLLLIALLLYAATLATQDCATGAYSSDNCLWLWVRGRLGLAPSRAGHALTLELVGLAILAGLYLTVCYVFPRSRSRARPENAAENGASGTVSARKQ